MMYVATVTIKHPRLHTQTIMGLYYSEKFIEQVAKEQIEAYVRQNSQIATDPTYKVHVSIKKGDFSFILNQKN